MGQTISNTDLSKFHQVDIASIYNVDKLFRNIFDTKPLKMSSEEDKVIYLQGFYRSLPLSLAIQGNVLYFRLDTSHQTYDNHAYGTLVTRLLDKHYGPAIFTKLGSDDTITFYSRELKIFENQ